MGTTNCTPLNCHCLILIDHRAPSWELRVSLKHSLDDSKIDPRMREFASTVHPKHHDISRLCLSSEPLMIYGTQSPGSIKPSTFEQKISFRYRLVGAPQWIFEIAKYDTFGNQSRGPIKSTWRAKMWNDDWDTEVASNSNLEIGQYARWFPGIRTFFPNIDNKRIDGVEAGIVEFEQRVQRVNQLLQDIQESECF